jgi:hypothetical protein
MKKWLAFLALAILPFASAQASTLPNVLAGLDNTSNIEVMNDQQLSEVRGTGDLFAGWIYKEYHYDYLSGSQYDFRSYYLNVSTMEYGGKDIGGGYHKVGEFWFTDTFGSTPVEEHGYKVTPNGTGITQTLNYHDTYNSNNWGRSWDGVFRTYYTQF